MTARLLVFRNVHAFSDRALDLHLHVVELDRRIEALDPYDDHYKEDWLSLVEQREKAIRMIAEEWTEAE